MISCVSNLIQLGDILSKRVQRNFDKMCGMRPRDFYRGDPVCMYSENTFCCGLKVIRFPGIAKLYLQPSSRHKVFLSLQSVNLSSKTSLQTIKQKQKIVSNFLLLLQNAYITSHCYFLSNLVFVS